MTTNNLKKKLLRHRGEECERCHSILKQNELTVHHIVPKRVGGSDYLDNLRLLCRPCHDKEDYEANLKYGTAQSFGVKKVSDTAALQVYKELAESRGRRILELIDRISELEKRLGGKE